jgi:UDP-N-acetylglucosamine 1-carboxyvinyltransferase
VGSFRIEGGHRLQGEITPQGAKNEALQILCATLLTAEEVIIDNIPDIVDVNNLINLLADLGVKIKKLGKGKYSFEASDVNIEYLLSDEYRDKSASLRGSVMIIGPLLARFGKGYIPKPGGDKIGRRRLDTHFNGFIELGARFNYDRKANFYTVDARELKGRYILLEEASVTGTANLIMAAVLAKGTTTIYHAACEPYIQQLCKMLVSMGAK